MMLIQAVKSLFDRGTEKAASSEAVPESTTPASPAPDPLHVAACVLLLDIAYADGEFTDDEREHLEDVLGRHFSLGPDAGRELIALAEVEREAAVDHFQFTRQLQQGYDLGQKMVLAEVMWGLVLADGKIADHEHYLARKIANLLDLEPGYLSTAKSRATESAKKHP
jgi:uncharacterized tellurite resistance protein B-like protein